MEGQIQCRVCCKPGHQQYLVRDYTEKRKRIHSIPIISHLARTKLERHIQSTNGAQVSQGPNALRTEVRMGKIKSKEELFPFGGSEGASRKGVILTAT